MFDEDRLAVREKPASSPVMFQTWSNLLFLHWEIDVQEIAKRIPNRLSVDLHEGKTYLGLVPFFMKKVRPRFLPQMPGLSNFLELNIRAYVHDEQGRPGVWFFSLDCDQPIAVEVARKFSIFLINMLKYRPKDRSIAVSVRIVRRKPCLITKALASSEPQSRVH